MKMNYDINELPADTKLNIAKAQQLLESVQEKMKQKGLCLDLTCKMQLRDDCKNLEKCLKRIYKKKPEEKDIHNLELAIIKLTTTSGAILK